MALGLQLQGTEIWQQPVSLKEDPGLEAGTQANWNFDWNFARLRAENPVQMYLGF